MLTPPLNRTATTVGGAACDDVPRLVEPETKTEEYEFAESVTRAKVVVEIYDNRPYSAVQIVRARCNVDGTEHGYEIRIRPVDDLTIGQSLDIALRKLATVFTR